MGLSGHVLLKREIQENMNKSWRKSVESPTFEDFGFGAQELQISLKSHFRLLSSCSKVGHNNAPCVGMETTALLPNLDIRAVGLVQILSYHPNPLSLPRLRKCIVFNGIPIIAGLTIWLPFFQSIQKSNIRCSATQPR